MKILLLDPQWGQTAFLVAELAEAGCEPVLVSPHPPDPRGIGRLCRQIVSPEVGAPAYRTFISKVIAAERADLVLPTSEAIYEIVWNLTDVDQGRLFPATDARQRLLLTDRREMYRFCNSLGVPTPATIPLTCPADVQVAAREFGFPLVIRGTRGAAGDQVRIAADHAEAAASYEYILARSPDEPFAQAYATGQRTLIGGLLDRGKCLQWFSQQTVETFPPVTGPSIRVLSLRDPTLTSYAERLFLGLEWSGLACAEFIRNPVDGTFSFLEINPRPWAAIHAAHQCGVPLLRLFAHFLLRRTAVPPVEFPSGREIALFPQYLATRMRTGRLAWGDVRPCLQALRGAPWTRPALLYHFMKHIWWARGA